MKPAGTTAAVGVLILCLLGCGADKPIEKPPVPVKIQMVKAFSEETSTRFSGAIRPLAQVELSFRVGGYVKEILKVKGQDGLLRFVQEGDRIDRGTILAGLRIDDYRAKENQIKSQLSEAEAALHQSKAQSNEASTGMNYARLDFDRAETLYRLKSLTKPDYDASKARLESAQARVEGAQALTASAQAKIQGIKAALDEMDLTLKDTSLPAPYEGILMRRTIEPGSLVQPGVPAFIFSDTSQVKVVFGVSDLMMAQLKSSSNARVVIEALSGFEYMGKISRISASADPMSRLFEAEVMIPNPHNRLKPGMIASVQVMFPKPTPPLVVVPLSALFRPAGQSAGFSVFILEEQSGKTIARIRPVALGRSVENEMEITQGLRTGERIIVSGAQFVTDGQAVKVVQ
jgi:multidrug efflux pump subunit AcrA (membrane-fusion protein)